MTIEDVETFLAVVELGNLSLAAGSLFISQSTVSQRIQALENELDTTLLHRRRGHKNVEPTVSGYEFVPIAQQWMALWKDTQALRHHTNRQLLVIGSVDLINSYTFVPLYRSFLETDPGVQLKICTHHSNELHSLLETRAIDIGFAFSQVRYENIISDPIYREKMYLLCSADNDYYDDIHPSQLRAEDEVYLRWGPDYEMWHDRYWPNRKSLIMVNTGSLIPPYLEGKNRWSIVPMSAVHSLQRENLTHYRLNCPPPPRICYQITHKYPKASSAEGLRAFTQAVGRFVSTSDAICTFEPWMLEEG